MGLVFFLQDLVAKNYSSIKFYIPFNGFDKNPLPNNVEEYQLYKTNMIDFVTRYYKPTSLILPS